MAHTATEHVDRIIRIALCVLLFILIVLCLVLFQEYQRLRQSNIINAHGFLMGSALHHASTPATSADTDLIQSWMTFDYINHVFALPPTYLQTTLHITATSYPRLSLSTYARTQHLDAATFLASVQNAVHAYLITQNK